jgi:hypothetical protein
LGKANEANANNKNTDEDEANKTKANTKANHKCLPQQDLELSGPPKQDPKLSGPQEMTKVQDSFWKLAGWYVLSKLYQNKEGDNKIKQEKAEELVKKLERGKDSNPATKTADNSMQAEIHFFDLQEYVHSKLGMEHEAYVAG